jgi:hypothetical protein
MEIIRNAFLQQKDMISGKTVKGVFRMILLFDDVLGKVKRS